MTTLARAPRIAVPEQIQPGAFRGFDREAQILALAGTTMGTRWNVRLAAADVTQGPHLTRLVQQRLDDLVAQMSHWDENSDLDRFNRAPANSWHHLRPDFAKVVASALAIADASDGAFSPALGRLTDAWGLAARQVDVSPAAAELTSLSAHSDWRTLAFDPLGARLRQPGGLWLDLSGIAKGYAADAVADLLAAHDFHHALVEIGGECAGRGLKPSGEPWWVDVETPPGLATPPLRVALHALGIATSGDYLRGAHTLDPRTGQPAIHATTAVTVLHPRCMHADAWASALCVLRPEEARALACREGLMVRLLLRDGEEWLSPAFCKLL
ncbi:FAD:protein FMN transferase [Novosphingobium profundi]|uniref:FAD:protein FMN transferase n=1 Tax=Novosphingobium profundi TaxID=1774954 RepID=UPI0031BA64DF